MTPKNYIFETRFAVRDYECDVEGIVNNAQYIHYCEHTRHCFLNFCHISFYQLHNAGTDAMVARIEAEYKRPLRPDDVVVSRMNISKEGARYVFHHDLYREADNKLCFSARIHLICTVNGRLARTSAYDDAFAPYFSAVE